MTKAKEIETLQKAINELGNQSYLGGWLASIMDELQRDLRCDYIPIITLKDARDEATKILIEAHQKAEEIKLSATSEAQCIRENALKYDCRVRSQLRAVLIETLNSIPE